MLNNRRSYKLNSKAKAKTLGGKAKAKAACCKAKNLGFKAKAEAKALRPRPNILQTGTVIL